MKQIAKIFLSVSLVIVGTSAGVANERQSGAPSLKRAVEYDVSRSAKLRYGVETILGVQNVQFQRSRYLRLQSNLGSAAAVAVNAGVVMTKLSGAAVTLAAAIPVWSFDVAAAQYPPFNTRLKLAMMKPFDAINYAPVTKLSYETEFEFTQQDERYLARCYLSLTKDYDGFVGDLTARLSSCRLWRANSRSSMFQRDLGKLLLENRPSGESVVQVFPNGTFDLPAFPGPQSVYVERSDIWLLRIVADYP